MTHNLPSLYVCPTGNVILNATNGEENEISQTKFVTFICVLGKRDRGHEITSQIVEFSACCPLCIGNHTILSAIWNK